MEHWLTTKQVADLEGITERAIRKKIQTYVLTREIEGRYGRGGKQHEIHVSSLSAAVQQAYRARQAAAPAPRAALNPLDYPAWALAELQRRQAILQAWDLVLAQTPRKQAQAAKKAFCAAHGLTMATLYRWEAARRDGGAAGLLPGYQVARPTQRKLTPDLIGKIREWWLTPKRRAVTVVAEMLAQYCQQMAVPCPSYDTIAKLCRTLSQSEQDLHRTGAAAWRARHEPTVIRDAAALRTLEIVCGDHRQLDILCKVKIDLRIRGVRRTAWAVRAPWLTLLLDIHSWCFVGWHVAWRPSSETIALGLRDCLITVGVPESLYFDCGKDYRSRYFKNKRLLVSEKFKVGVNADIAQFTAANQITLNAPETEGILDALAIDVRHAQPVNFKAPFNGGVARAKPIESAFNWFIAMEKEYPGWRANDPKQMPETTKRLISGAINEDTPLPVLDDVIAAVAASIAEHNARPHGDRARAAGEYLTDAGIMRLPASQHEALNILLWPFTKCKVHNAKIYVNNLPYVSPELAKWGGETLTARLDPQNTARVVVMTQGRPSAVVCVAENQELQRMSWHPSAADVRDYVVTPRKEARRAVEGLGEAYETLQSSDAELLARGRRAQQQAETDDPAPPPKPRGGKPKPNAPAKQGGLQQDGKTYVLADYREQQAGTTTAAAEAAPAAPAPLPTGAGRLQKVLPRVYHDAAARIHDADHKQETPPQVEQTRRLRRVNGQWVANG